MDDADAIRADVRKALAEIDRRIADALRHVNHAPANKDRELTRYRLGGMRIARAIVARAIGEGK